MQVDSLHGEIIGLKSDINLLNQEVKKRDGIIESLRNDIASLKKEIQERDDTIRDKASVIHVHVIKINNNYVVSNLYCSCTVLYYMYVLVHLGAKNSGYEKEEPGVREIQICPRLQN